MLDIENLRIIELLSYQFTVESSDRHKVGLHKWTLVYLVRPASNRGKTLNIEVRFMSPPLPPKEKVKFGYYGWEDQFLSFK